MGFPDNLCIWILAGMLGLFGYVDETRGQTLVTIAGTELPDGTRIPVWWVGDGLSATDAILSNPFSVSVDVNGRIYIADSSHNRVRVIDESGRIRGVAGTGAIGFSGDGSPAGEAKLATPLGVFFAPSGVFRWGGWKVARGPVFQSPYWTMMAQLASVTSWFSQAFTPLNNVVADCDALRFYSNLDLHCAG